MLFDFSSFLYAYGKPQCSAVLKLHPEDFIVEEKIAYPLSGQGEHLWVWVEKKGENSADLSEQLARWAGVNNKNIGYGGKKDRHAITRQWMSVHLPGKEDPSVDSFVSKNSKILKTIRHNRKLQTGGLSGNSFKLVLRNLTGDCKDLISRCEQVKKKGVPNYFGKQRFGRGMGNLEKVSQLFLGEQRRRVKRHQKGLYLSSARSWIFNQILSKRIECQSWSNRMSGDVFMLEGSSKCFVDDAETEADLVERLFEGDIHPSGLLAGRGQFLTTLEALKIEQKVIQEFSDWQEGLEKSGMKQERRALRVFPKNMAFKLVDDTLHLRFELPAGSYATMVIRELVMV